MEHESTWTKIEKLRNRAKAIRARGCVGDEVQADCMERLARDLESSLAALDHLLCDLYAVRGE